MESLDFWWEDGVDIMQKNLGGDVGMQEIEEFVRTSVHDWIGIWRDKFLGDVRHLQKRDKWNNPNKPGRY